MGFLPGGCHIKLWKGPSDKRQDSIGIQGFAVLLLPRCLMRSFWLTRFSLFKSEILSITTDSLLTSLQISTLNLMWRSVRTQWGKAYRTSDCLISVSILLHPLLNLCVASSQSSLFLFNLLAYLPFVFLSFLPTLLKLSE